MTYNVFGGTLSLTQSINPGLMHNIFTVIYYQAINLQHTGCYVNTVFWKFNLWRHHKLVGLSHGKRTRRYLCKTCACQYNKQWNNFENRLIFDEVKAYQKNCAIFGPPCICVPAADGEVWDGVEVRAKHVGVTEHFISERVDSIENDTDIGCRHPFLTKYSTFCNIIVFLQYCVCLHVCFFIMFAAYVRNK